MVALIVLREKAEQKTNALIDPLRSIGNDGYYLNRGGETPIPAPAQKHRLCSSASAASMPRLNGALRGGARGDLPALAEYLRLDRTRGIPRLRGVRAAPCLRVCQCGSREAAQQRAGGAYPRLTTTCGLSRRICRRVLRGHLLAVGKPRLRRRGCAPYNAPGLRPRVPRTETPQRSSTRGMTDESEQL